MQYYQAKIGKITGSNFKEMHKKAESIFHKIKNKSKRKPYIRSAYFNKDKVFLDYFWEHLFAKQNLRDKQRRIALYAAAIELIEKDTISPESTKNPNKKSETLYRFYGRTKENSTFIVQIKKDERADKKYFISVYPA